MSNDTTVSLVSLSTASLPAGAVRGAVGAESTPMSPTGALNSVAPVSVVPPRAVAMPVLAAVDNLVSQSVVPTPLTWKRHSVIPAVESTGGD